MVINSVSSRLRQTMSEQRLNCVQLAAAANVKTSFLYDILSGKSANPSAVQLAKVAHALNISLLYLVGTDKAYAEYPALAKDSSDYTKIAHIALDKHDNKIISQIDAEPDFQFCTNWLKNSFGLSAKDAKIFRVTSDEMSPTLVCNDSVLVNVNSKLPTPPGIFLIFDGIGLTTRRIEYIGNPKKNCVRILTDNPRYSPDMRTLDDMLILGRVVWFTRCV
jgi:phage repressor protein C with HTH and peptisase S24 domain